MASKAPLDEVDLALVEAGKEGIRGWTPDERRLVQVSIDRRLQRKEERRRLQAEREELQRREQVEREARSAADVRAEVERKNAGRLRRRALLLAGLRY